MEQLQQLINQSNHIVFFGGAGVSTASGIPDFRSSDGLYNKKQETLYPPEVMLSHSFYKKHTQEFYDFYKNHMIYLDAKPNAAHYKLTELEQAGKLTAVITQNIDGLHQQAGTETVLELHGSVHRNYCQDCHTFYPLDTILQSTNIPTCSCGGIIKPDVVLYEESLDGETLEQSAQAVSKADLLIVGGTSLTVYPAASFVSMYCGKNLVIINQSPTSQDKNATLVLKGNIATIFDQITIA